MNKEAIISDLLDEAVRRYFNNESLKEIIEDIKIKKLMRENNRKTIEK